MSTQLLGSEVVKATPASSLPLYKTLETSGVPVPSELLMREYPVASFTWTPGVPANTLLASLDFPEILFTPYIRSKLQGFRYFTCEGVQVRIQIADRKSVV